MTGLEILLLILVLVGVLVAAALVRAVSPFIINAVVGLVVLFLAQAVFGFSVALTPIVLGIVALGGLPGSIAVLVLSLLGIAFVP
ncbi:pro-sigmaK processing inhibitor BofA family protein [Natronorubrum thiooxidans]|uniref:SigmaK-factor processing regulatory protein BofA n=1 Tax=Natronorubrum thiooxidans TaxID=308853 RepID=A0A1N7GPU9_9EURY|nr:pro-sigmaK processing inhibitor BofA family protein [Natronorubrum thiooxidans]SIS14498.1 SigmaK-factor processing regulatory protein BofA [Natronorubrum thiooxidans]